MVVLEELTSAELELLLERGAKTAVIPFGSVEHQGRHLPLGSDALLANVVGMAVADRLDAALAPTVRLGSANSTWVARDRRPDSDGLLGVRCHVTRGLDDGCGALRPMHGVTASGDRELELLLEARLSTAMNVPSCGSSEVRPGELRSAGLLSDHAPAFLTALLGVSIRCISPVRVWRSSSI